MGLADSFFEALPACSSDLYLRLDRQDLSRPQVIVANSCNIKLLISSMVHGRLFAFLIAYTQHPMIRAMIPVHSRISISPPLYVT